MHKDIEQKSSNRCVKGTKIWYSFYEHQQVKKLYRHVASNWFPIDFGSPFGSTCSLHLASNANYNTLVCKVNPILYKFKMYQNSHKNQRYRPFHTLKHKFLTREGTCRHFVPDFVLFSPRCRHIVSQLDRSDFT